MICTSLTGECMAGGAFRMCSSYTGITKEELVLLPWCFPKCYFCDQLKLTRARDPKILINDNR